MIIHIYLGVVVVVVVVVVLCMFFFGCASLVVVVVAVVVAVVCCCFVSLISKTYRSCTSVSKPILKTPGTQKKIGKNLQHLFRRGCASNSLLRSVCTAFQFLRDFFNILLVGGSSQWIWVTCLNCENGFLLQNALVKSLDNLVDGSNPFEK